MKLLLLTNSVSNPLPILLIADKQFSTKIAEVSQRLGLTIFFDKHTIHKRTLFINALKSSFLTGLNNAASIIHYSVVFKTGSMDKISKRLLFIQKMRVVDCSSG